jgi:hypothetical protein
MDAKARDEEMKIKSFEEQKEIQDRLNDQLMYNKHKSDQQRMREDLARQVE